MTSLNVSLPEPLKDYVEAQVRQGSYSTPSEYVRSLIREDQQRRAEERLERALLHGLASGPPAEADREFWKRKRRQLASRRRKGTAR
ncbi:MAG: type II toxin-antitoxin system ParD family antitoxin [Acidobacteria bacterium]|nr:type II toxin-antitoxin system ParD family antitoxin [Acidobacteriota bacterium]